jgi:xanthine dehydrogenase accessory factor
MSSELYRAVVAALDRGERAAIVTVIAVRGSAPQRVGAKMLVFADGRIVGTVGGGYCEADAAAKARESIETRIPRVVRYDLSDEAAGDSGLVCGGQMEVYLEPIETPPHLYVVGAGHVGASLARLASETGFQVHVLDDREQFASRERFPSAVEVVVDSIPSWLERATLPTDAFVVVVTRGHHHDLAALQALAGRRLRYVGMIGSRTKVNRVRQELLAGSVPSAWVDDVHAPIGLDIGAVTPAEIAVSILAEMIAVRYGKATGVRVEPSPMSSDSGTAPVGA